MAELEAFEVFNSEEEKKAALEKLNNKPVAQLNAGDKIERDTWIESHTKKVVTCIDKKFWYQVGTLPEGIKFAVMYADDEVDSPTRRKFIAAWDVTARKVYGESGPIGPVDWNVVEVKLNMSDKESVMVEDPILGGKVEVNIGKTFGSAGIY